MKRATILFDLDGTLIDSTEAILDSFSYAFAKFGKSAPPKERILALIGHPLDFMFTHLGIEENVEDYVHAYKERYRIISKEKTKLLPNARKAIKEAASFATLGVVTTKTGLYSRKLLEHMGVMGYFGVLIGREDVIYPKPHPEPILKAMHRLSAHKEHTYMIGDTCLDMEAAHAAGIQGIAVVCGYQSSEELVRCTRHVTEDALEAVRFIKRIYQ